MPSRIERDNYPWRLERLYARRLVAVVRRIHRVIRAELAPHIRALRDAHRRAAVASDADEEVTPEVALAWAQFESAVASLGFTEAYRRALELDRMAADLDRMGRQLDLFARRRAGILLRAVGAIPLQSVANTSRIAEFVGQNVDLITNLSTIEADRMRRLVSTELDAGTDPRIVARQVQESLGVAESRANLIARDQVAKANAQIQRDEMRGAGVERYRWSDSDDRRVRRRHAQLDGTIQSWDDPPIVDPRTGRRGHPGEDFQCRCVAIPVLDEDED